MNSVLSLFGLGAASPVAKSGVSDDGNNVLKVYSQAVWDKLEERIASGKGPEAASLHILISLLQAKTQDPKLNKAPPARLTVPGSLQVDELRVALSKYTNGAMRVGRVYVLEEDRHKELVNGKSLYHQGIKSGMKLSVEALATDHIRRSVCAHVPLDRFDASGGDANLDDSAPEVAPAPQGAGRAHMVPSMLPVGPVASMLPVEPIKSVLGDKRSREDKEVTKAGSKAGPSASVGKKHKGLWQEIDEEEARGGVHHQAQEEEEEEEELPPRPSAHKTKGAKKRKTSKSVPSSPLAPPSPPPAEPEAEPEAPQKSSWDEEANMFLMEGVRKYCVRTSEHFTGMAWAKIALEGRGILPFSSNVPVNAACKDRWRTIVKNVERDFVGSRDKSFTDTVRTMAKEVHAEEKQGLEHGMEEPEQEEED